QINSISSISSLTGNTGVRNDGCIDQYSFSATINFGGSLTHVSNTERTAQVTGQSSCIPIRFCQTNPSSYTNTACDVVTGILVNPFVEGIRGNYRPLSSYVYNKGERINDTASSLLPLRISGFYNDQFRPFWVCPAF